MESLTTGPELENSQGQSRRLSDLGMSASPPTSDVLLRPSELTLRANLGHHGAVRCAYERVPPLQKHCGSSM